MDINGWQWPFLPATGPTTLYREPKDRLNVDLRDDLSRHFVTLLCGSGFFVADCKAWQSDFQRGVAAIAEFYKEDSGTPVEWEELLPGDAMDIFWSLFFRTEPSNSMTSQFISIHPSKGQS